MELNRPAWDKSPPHPPAMVSDWAAGLMLKPVPPPPPPRASSNGQRSAAGDGILNCAWALSAFNREVAALTTAPDSVRNNTLNGDAALRLYRIALAGLLDENEITIALTRAARVAGLPDSEIDGTLRSARAGADKYGPAEDALKVRRKIEERASYSGGFDVPPDWHAAADAAAAGQGGSGPAPTTATISIRSRRRSGPNWPSCASAVRPDAGSTSRTVRRSSSRRSRTCAHCSPNRKRRSITASTRWPRRNARIICSAQYKAGKTTLVGNLIRSLVDSDPFLGRFAVHMPARRIVLIDNEMSLNTLRRWLRDQKINTVSAVADVIALRGKTAAFDLLDDRRRAEWATRLRDVGCDYLLFDCLRPVLDALGLV